MLAIVGSWFAAKWAKFAVVAGAVLAAAATLLTLYESVKGSGETEQQNADLKEGLKDVQISTQIDTAVAAMPAATVHDELYSKFSRSD